MMWSKSSRDHNATSYSTETSNVCFSFSMWYSRDHNATSYSTETTSQHDQTPSISAAEIITLRAIALKLHASWLDVFARCCRDHNATSYSTETSVWTSSRVKAVSRDHNATSYSTETRRVGALIVSASGAEIITLRAIALKLYKGVSDGVRVKKAEIITLRAIALKPFGSPPQQVVSLCRDHNATSYSTETRGASGYLMCFFSR